MDLSRRDFLKATGIGGISLALSSLGFDLKEAKAAAHTFKLEGAREFTSICHFCACGCGVIGYVKDGKLINLEGATDSPINAAHSAARASLCGDPELEGARDETSVPRTGQRSLGGDQLG